MSLDGMILTLFFLSRPGLNGASGVPGNLPFANEKHRSIGFA